MSGRNMYEGKKKVKISVRVSRMGGGGVVYGMNGRRNLTAGNTLMARSLQLKAGIVIAL